ncbi:MAG: histidine phosphatase family protein [Candidatus Woesearchaeota archaeon]|jgi:broad specificity phosphatase PhoE
MRLILTRHGETEENKAGIMQGWLPGKLTKLGQKQAQQLAQRLKWLKIDLIYTSDLARCVDTAKEIAKFHTNTKIIEEKRLREMDHGELTGRKKGEVEWNPPPGKKFTDRFLGGESYEDVLIRVKKFYHNLLKDNSDKTVVIVTHGGVLMLLHSLIKGTSIEESLKYKQKNTGVSEYQIDSKRKYKEICFNCEKHL